MLKLFHIKYITELTAKAYAIEHNAPNNSIDYIIQVDTGGEEEDFLYLKIAMQTKIKPHAASNSYSRGLDLLDVLYKTEPFD